MLPEIFVDGDACPVREEIYRVAQRMGLSVRVVANGSRPIRPPGLPFVAIVLVGEGADKADDWIADHITARDVCVTADIPLAARCLAKGAAALAFNGTVWSEANIGNALAGRELNRHLREMGLEGGGGRPFGKSERSRFLNALDTVLVAARKRAMVTP